MALFKGVKLDKSNADIGWMNNRSAFYSHGYRASAEKLIKEYGGLPLPERDSMVFPVVFLYRHYLEIEIKDLIYRIAQCLGDVPSEITHHRLLELWDILDSKYSTLSDDISDEYNFCPDKDRKKIRNLIVEFNKFDQTSFAFRYPKDVKGNKSITGINYISLNNFKTEISKVINVIDKINETICHYEEYLSYNQ